MNDDYISWCFTNVSGAYVGDRISDQCLLLRYLWQDGHTPASQTTQTQGGGGGVYVSGRDPVFRELSSSGRSDGGGALLCRVRTTTLQKGYDQTKD